MADTLTAEQRASIITDWLGERAEIAAAIREAEQAARADELQRNAEAICYYCAAHDEFEPAVWADEDDEELVGGEYRHRNKKGGGTAWCQANLIWADWAERNDALNNEKWIPRIAAAIAAAEAAARGEPGPMEASFGEGGNV